MPFPQTDFPHWAQTALAESSWEGFIDVDGAWIHYITWGDVTKPPLVLIHGNAAELFALYAEGGGGITRFATAICTRPTALAR